MITPKQKTQRGEILTQAHQDYAKGMTSHSFFKVNNHATSDDLVQETFIKTWRYLVKQGKVNNMKAFLYHVLNQLIIDEYRKRKTISLEVLFEKGYQPSIDNSERIFNIFDGKIAVLLIQHLSTKYQKVIRMRYIQSLSIKEISLITGQSRNTVAVQIHRGLAQLKVLYERK